MIVRLICPQSIMKGEPMLKNCLLLALLVVTCLCGLMGGEGASEKKPILPKDPASWRESVCKNISEQTVIAGELIAFAMDKQKTGDERRLAVTLLGELNC